MPKPSILFDLDGTLIDSTVPIYRAFKLAFRNFNKPEPKDEQIKALIGHPLSFMFSSLGAPKDEIDAFIKIYKDCYAKYYLDETILLNGCADALENAASFADLAVVTTKTSKYSCILLEHLGVLKYFKAIIGADDVNKLKPDPEPIFTALKAMNKSSKNAFMIGDTSLDALAAKAAKVRAIGVRCGFGKNLQEYFEEVFDDAKSALEWIKCDLKVKNEAKS